MRACITTSSIYSSQHARNITRIYLHMYGVVVYICLLTANYSTVLEVGMVKHDRVVVENALYYQMAVLC